MSERSKTKIRDSCVTSIIHKDIWLDMCKNGTTPGIRTIAYSLEVTVDCAAGVKKAKTFSDIG